MTTTFFTLLSGVPAFFAVVSEPAPAGRSSKAGVAIILLCFAILFAFALRATVRHLRGGGGCCCGGGGAAEPAPSQDGAGKKIGLVVCRREIEISGMHCMNCVGRVRKALDALPGVLSDVTLDPPRAFVKADREVSDGELRAAVEALGFQVLSVTAR